MYKKKIMKSFTYLPKTVSNAFGILPVLIILLVSSTVTAQNQINDLTPTQFALFTLVESFDADFNYDFRQRLAIIHPSDKFDLKDVQVTVLGIDEFLLVTDWHFREDLDSNVVVVKYKNILILISYNPRKDKRLYALFEEDRDESR